MNFAPKSKIAKIALSLISILVLFTSCEKENNEPDDRVEACFEMSADSIIAGDEVEFFNCSENATKFLWKFGDNKTSEKQEPNNIFDKPGSYEIVLIAGRDNNRNQKLDAFEPLDSISGTLIVSPKNQKSVELTIRNADLWTPANPNLDPPLQGATVNLYTSPEQEIPDFTLTSDENGKAVFYDLSAGTYFLTVKHENLSNITAAGFLIMDVFQTHEEINNTALQPNNPTPGSLKYVDVNADGRIDSLDHVTFDTIRLGEEVLIRDVVIGKEQYRSNS